MFKKKNEIFSSEIRLRKVTEKYEERLKEQEIEYNEKLKSMAKEMNTQIDEKEKNYNQQLNDFIRKFYKKKQQHFIFVLIIFFDIIRTKI